MFGSQNILKASSLNPVGGAPSGIFAVFERGKLHPNNVKKSQNMPKSEVLYLNLNTKHCFCNFFGFGVIDRQKYGQWAPHRWGAQYLPLYFHIIMQHINTNISRTMKPNNFIFCTIFKQYKSKQTKQKPVQSASYWQSYGLKTLFLGPI